MNCLLVDDVIKNIIKIGSDRTKFTFLRVSKEYYNFVKSLIHPILKDEDAELCFNDHDYFCLYFYNNVEYWNYMLEEACYYGEWDTIHLTLLRGANKLTYALSRAAQGNQIEIIHFLLGKGANSWDLALEGAVFSNNLGLVKFFHSKGVKYCDMALLIASSRGYLEIAQFLLQHGSPNNINYSLCSAANHGHVPIVKLLINYGANNWNSGLKEACCPIVGKSFMPYNEQGRVEIAKLMIDYGADYCSHCNNKNHIFNKYIVYGLVCSRIIPHGFVLSGVKEQIKGS